MMKFVVVLVLLNLHAIMVNGDPAWKYIEDVQAVQEDADADTVRYGDPIFIRNLWNSKKIAGGGTLLDVRNYYVGSCSPVCTKAYKVYTVNDGKYKKTDGSWGATWMIEGVESVESKECVKYGDKIHIRSIYKEGFLGNAEGYAYYLDTCDTSEFAQPSYQVNVGRSASRDGNSGTWTIEQAGIFVGSGCVKTTDDIHLKSLFRKGTYLESRGVAGEECGGKYMVSTSGGKMVFGGGGRHGTAFNVVTNKDTSRDGPAVTWRISKKGATSGCDTGIKWAFGTGKKNKDAWKWYADMLEIVGVSAKDATLEDFQRYFICAKKCQGLKYPTTCSKQPCDTCPWKLGEYFMMPANTKCASGWIESRVVCEAAAKQLKLKDTDVDGNTRQNSSWLPKGCSMKNGRLHFNTFKGSKAFKEYKPICRKV